MRLFTSALTIILLVIGAIGLTIGLMAISVAGKVAGAAGIVAALQYAAPLLLLGVIGLGAAAIVITIEQASNAQITAINRGTQVAINEAKLAEHRRKE